MSNLHDKLAKLKAKQDEIERQIAARASIENAAVSSAFAILLSSSANAYKLTQACPDLDKMSARDRGLFDSWLSRIEPPNQPQSAGSTSTVQYGSTETHSGSTT